MHKNRPGSGPVFFTRDKAESVQHRGTRRACLVQRNNKTTLPQKVPSRYRISLHVDDESVICTLGRQYGFNAYQLDAQDDDWEEKIVQRAEQIKRREFPSAASEEG